MKNLILTLFGFIGTSAFAAIGTGPGGQFIINTTTLQPNATFYVSSGTVTNLQTATLKFRDGTTQTTASISGGGSSSLEVKVNSVQISSPTKTIAFDSNFSGNQSPTGTSNISLNPGSTLYIQNTGTLQASSQFYVSSGSVNGPLSVFRNSLQALLTPSTTEAFSLVNVSSHQVYILLKSSGTSWWRVGNDVTNLGTPEFDIYNATTGIKDVSISTNDVITSNANIIITPLNASQPVKTDINKGLISGLINVTSDITGTLPTANLPANIDYTNVQQTISANKIFTSSITFRNLNSGSGQCLGLDSSSNTIIVPCVASLSVSSVTLQGNTFNSANKLLQLDGSALVPSAQIPTTLSSYIQNRGTLQSGSTFYVSSGTVDGQFSINGWQQISQTNQGSNVELAPVFGDIENSFEPGYADDVSGKPYYVINHARLPLSNIQTPVYEISASTNLYSGHETEGAFIQLSGKNVRTSSSSIVLSLDNNSNSAVLTPYGFGFNNGTPTQALDIVGNVQFSGALMPGASAGSSGQILQSNGAGVNPTWIANSGSSAYIQNSSTLQSGAAFYLSSGTIQNYLTINGNPSSDQSAVTRGYIGSRSQNLVTNGSGLLGNNYNFSRDYFGGSGFAFDPVDTHGGGGSFKVNQAYGEFVTDEFMPVDTQKTYRLVAWGKSGDTNGSNYNASNLELVGVVAYDADQLNIEPLYFSKHSGSTDTTLAVQVNPGATTITLTNATGWYNGTVNAAVNQMSWWPYSNSKGYSYQSYTYTRNTSYYIYSGGYTYATDGLWGTGGISGNVITLTHPWTGPTLPVGTPVRNCESGGTFKYITMVGAVPNIWTRYEGYIGGIDVNGQQNLNQFPYGTAYLKPIFLTDYHGAADNNIRWSDIWLSELSAVNLETASGTQIGVVLPGTQTFGGNKTIQAQASTDIPLLLQGAASQSANLQAWTDSSGVALSSVAANGGFSIRPRTKAQLSVLAPGVSNLIFTCTDCTTDGLVISTGTLAGQFGRVSARTTAIQ